MYPQHISPYNDSVELRTSLELRLLPDMIRAQISQKVEDQSWKDLFAIIPGPPWQPGDSLPDIHCHYVPKYTSQDIRFISAHCDKEDLSFFHAFAEEWGTSGTVRPTLKDLLALLERNHLIRASTFIKEQVLKIYVPETHDLDLLELEEASLRLQQQQREENNTMTSPILAIGTQQSTDCNGIGMDSNFNGIICEKDESLESANEIPLCNNNNSIELKLQSPVNGSNLSSVSTVNNQSSLPINFKDHMFAYSLLKCSTNNFSDTHKIGEGAFGKVYRGSLSKTRKVAIKCLKPLEENIHQQFMNEIATLLECKHDNVVPLEGYSMDGPQLCLVYKYMPNGSLQDRIGQVEDTPPLSWKMRINITKGIAEGLNYLHTGFDRPLVHRDIKSANILLNEHMIPKIADFGLARLGAVGINPETIVRTRTIIGTSAYMAPEVLRGGDISSKIDVFSFGVVLLEILTGLPPCSKESYQDLLTFFEDYEGNVIDLLDIKAGEWDKTIASQIFELVYLCTKSKPARPLIQAVLKTINTF